MGGTIVAVYSHDDFLSLVVSIGITVGFDMQELAPTDLASIVNVCVSKLWTGQCHISSVLFPAVLFLYV